MFNQKNSSIDPARTNLSTAFSNMNNTRWPNVGSSMANIDANNISCNSEMLNYKLRELKNSYPEISNLSSIYEYPNSKKSEVSKLMTEPPKLFNTQSLNQNYSITKDSPAIKVQPKKRGRRKLSEKK